MESAVPLNQLELLAVMVGVNRNIPPCLRPKFHHLLELRCSLSDLELYCVSTATLPMFEFVMLLSAKSMAL